MKKKLALILAIVMIGASLVGCSTDELEFYHLIWGLNQNGAVKSEGVYEINLTGEFINLLLAEATPEEYSEITKILNLVNGIQFRQNSIENLEQQRAITKIEVKFPGDNDFQELTELILNKNVIYIKVSTLRELAENILPEEALYDVPAGYEYAVYNLEDEMHQDTNYKELVDAYKPFIDLFIEAYKDLDFKLVEKENNVYTLLLTPEKLIDTFYRLIEYTKNNSEDISNKLTTAIDNLTDEEFNLLLEVLEITEEDGINKEIIKAGIRQAFDEIPYDEIEASRYETDSQIIPAIAGSGYKMTLEKVDDSTIKTSDILAIKYMENMFNLTLRSSQLITTGYDDSAVIYGIDPHAIVLDLNEYADDYKEYLEEYDEYSTDEQRTLSIDTRTNFYELSNGTIIYNYGEINIITQDGRIYLPLRQVGELLGEDVQWDQSTKTPYINRYGERTNMAGLLVDGKAYVKVRDFEKLGMEVEWNEATKTAHITR